MNTNVAFCNMGVNSLINTECWSKKAIKEWAQTFHLSLLPAFDRSLIYCTTHIFEKSTNGCIKEVENTIVTSSSLDFIVSIYILIIYLMCAVFTILSF